MDDKSELRKIMLTFNNPAKHGLTREQLLAQYNLLTSASYMCMCDEIGEKGTYHTHMYIYSSAPIRFSRIKKVFPSAHIDKAKGSHKEIRDYILKTGKYATSEKAKTNLSHTFFETGEMPHDRISATDKKEKLYLMIQSGMSNSEIIDADKNYLYQIKHMDEIRETLRADQYAKEDRELTIVYMYGNTGTGKTRTIHERHGAENICRITNYKKDGTVNFDAYHGQDVLVFEEFRGQVNLPDLLSWCDRYPLKLPARYFDKQACYTKVYFTSNVPLFDLYPEVQTQNPPTWNAFLRRIDKIMEFKADGSISEYSLHKKGKDNQNE